MYGNGKNYVLTVFALVISAATDVALAFMLLYVFEAAGNTTGGSLAFAAGFGAGFCLLYLLFRFLKRRYMNRYLKTALSQFKDYIFCRILGKSISSFGRESSAKFISAFSNDLNSIEQNYLIGSLNIIGALLSFIGSAIAMLIISWKLALPLIAFAVIFLGLSLVYGNRLVSKEKTTSNENMSFIDQVKDLLNGFIVIKSFKAENEVREIFRKQNATLETAKQNRRVTSDTVSIISDISSLVMNLTLFALGAITTVSEWRQIHCSSFKKVLYAFTFPLFMLTYLPIVVVSLFVSPGWKPIAHRRACTVRQIVSVNNGRHA